MGYNYDDTIMANTTIKVMTTMATKTPRVMTVMVTTRLRRQEI